VGGNLPATCLPEAPTDSSAQQRPAAAPSSARPHLPLSTTSTRLLKAGAPALSSRVLDPPLSLLAASSPRVTVVTPPTSGTSSGFLSSSPSELPWAVPTTITPRCAMERTARTCAGQSGGSEGRWELGGLRCTLRALLGMETHRHDDIQSVTGPHGRVVQCLWTSSRCCLRAPHNVSRRNMHGQPWGEQARQRRLPALPPPPPGPYLCRAADFVHHQHVRHVVLHCLDQHGVLLRPAGHHHAARAANAGVGQAAVACRTGSRAAALGHAVHHDACVVLPVAPSTQSCQADVR
jgi:hypothetical protein